MGDLEKAIEEFNNLPKTVTIKDESKVSENSVSSYDASATRASKKLYRISSVGDSYELTYSVSAQYSGKNFTGVSNPDVEVDSDLVVTQYEIGDNPDLTASYTSSKITMEADFYVDCYFLIADIGWLQIGHQHVESTIYWHASNEL